MTRTDLIELLDQIEAEYCVGGDHLGVEYDGIYIFDKSTVKLKERYKRFKKYAELYVPYIRVSHFSEEDHPGRWYVKDNGVCQWMKIHEVLNIIYDYTGRKVKKEA